MASGVKADLPPALDSSSDPPAIFDGTTKLYISYISPYAQRAWIARNYKRLQEKIKLVPINLENRPAWYKEKVYPPNKVPSLEHNIEVKGESLDLLKYIESNFEGPPLLPDDPVKREFAEELLSYTDSFNKAVFSSLKGDGIGEAGAAFDGIENALRKFDDGPFFLGNFSLVDIAYAPFIESFQPLLLDVKKYDITEGRPKLTIWIEEINKIEAYTVTKHDPKELVEYYKRFLAPSLEHNNEVKGESLDLLKYVESNFEGPPLLPDDPAKREFAEELLAYIDSFSNAVVSSFKEDGIGEAGAAFDHIENALGKFEDRPFFLANFSLVDIAYAPFIERYQPFLLDVKKYDIAEGRPMLATWIELLIKTIIFLNKIH